MNQGSNRKRTAHELAAEAAELHAALTDPLKVFHPEIAQRLLALLADVARLGVANE